MPPRAARRPAPIALRPLPPPFPPPISPSIQHIATVFRVAISRLQDRQATEQEKRDERDKLQEDVHRWNSINEYTTKYTPVNQASAEQQEVREAYIKAREELILLFNEHAQLIDDVQKITKLPTGHDLIIERLEKVMESDEDLAINMRQCILRKGNAAEDVRLQTLRRLVEKVESFEERRQNTSSKLDNVVDKVFNDGLTIDYLRGELETKEELMETIKNERNELQSQNTRLKQALTKKETEVEVLRQIKGKDQSITAAQLEQALGKVFEQQSLDQAQSLEDREANIQQTKQQLEAAATKYIKSISTVEQVRAKRVFDEERIQRLTEDNKKLETENRKLRINDNTHRTVCPTISQQRDELKQQVNNLTNQTGNQSVVEATLRQQLVAEKTISARFEDVAEEAVKGFQETEKRLDIAEANEKHWLQQYNEQKTAAREAIAVRKSQERIKKTLESHLAGEKAWTKLNIEKINKLIKDHRQERLEIAQRHQQELKKETDAAEAARAETRSVRKELEQKLEVETTARRQANSKQLEHLVYNTKLNNQVNAARNALNDEKAKVTQLQNDLANTSAELTAAKASLSTAEEERDNERASIQRLTASSTATTTATAQTVAQLKNELKTTSDTTKQCQQQITQLERKRDELTSENKNATDQISAWRCILLREVFRLENWTDAAMEELHLCELIELAWPALETVQQQALIVLDGHDFGNRDDVPVFAFSIWGEASIENPDLGLAEINSFATALLGFKYQTRILAFLQASIKKMIEKDLTEQQALFCFRGLELLCRCCPDKLRRLAFGEIFDMHDIYTTPNVVLARAAERLAGRLIDGHPETRGTAVKWTLEKHGFASYSLDNQYVLFPVKQPSGKDHVFLVNNGNQMTQLSYDNLECRASAYTGKYIVKVFDKAGTVIAKKECDLSDNLEPLYKVFPYEDLGLKFE
jgi:hypothetical protein